MITIVSSPIAPLSSRYPYTKPLIFDLTGVSEREKSSFDAVDKEIAAVEVVEHTPSSMKASFTSLSIVLWADVEETNFCETGSTVIGIDAGHIYHPETGTVVALIRDTVQNILVMIYTFLRALVDAAEDRVCKILDVNNICGGVLVCGGTVLLLLIQLVVQEQVLVVLSHPALVRVGGSVVRGPGELAWLCAAGNIDNCEGVLVEVEANLAIPVGQLRPLVNHALGVMNVPVVSDAAGVLGLARVGHIDHPQTTGALEGPRGTHGDDGVSSLASHDVVTAAEASEACGQARIADGSAVGRGVGWVGGAELGEVEDLQAVVRGLGANVGVVLDDLDVAPRGGDGLRGQAADIGQGAIGVDPDKGRTVRLADDAVLLSSRGVRPTCNCDLSELQCDALNHSD